VAALICANYFDWNNRRRAIRSPEQFNAELEEFAINFQLSETGWIMKVTSLEMIVAVMDVPP